MSVTIDPEATLLDITRAWPATLPVFVAQGFPQMADEAKRQAFAGRISLRQATALKQLDLAAFVALLAGAAATDTPAVAPAVAPVSAPAVAPPTASARASTSAWTY